MIEREVAAAIAMASEPLAVATVVGVRGSAYRRPGARMVFSQTEHLAGSVSGGCLEGELARTGWWHTERGPVVVTFDASDDDEVRRGTGCGGSIDILLERVGQRGVDPLAAIARCVSEQRRAVIATVISSTDRRFAIGTYAAIGDRVDGELHPDLAETLIADAKTALGSGTTRTVTYTTETGELQVLLEALVPPPQLFVMGTGPDAAALADCAHAIGWQVVVVAPSLRPTLRTRFARAELVADPLDTIAARIDAADRAAVVVINHDLARDTACLDRALASNASYVGALGPRQRTQKMLAEVGRELNDARLHAPVGLQLGAETPREIALAIVAEIQCELAHATGAPLRERDTAIHAETAQTGAVSSVSLRLTGCSAA
ncbi:MAG TPA: XdhC family protein [Kofleriaceae bacterium]|jgi:xanthine/CO dehydrogenase XdhC/CoxF family maturation factor